MRYTQNLESRNERAYLSRFTNLPFMYEISRLGKVEDEDSLLAKKVKYQCYSNSASVFKENLEHFI